MKLKYLFLAALTTAGMVSCSQDDKVDPNATYDAALNVSVAPSAETATKASTSGNDESGDAGESNIYRLTAFVFDASGATVAVKDTSSTVNISYIQDIVVKAKTQANGGTNYQMFLVANLHGNDALGVANLNALKGKMTDLSTETNTSLTMTSKLLNINVVGVEGERLHQNYVLNASGTSMGNGDTGLTNYNSLTTADYIPLTRVVSRIQLDEISISMVGSNYKGSTFRLDSVYLVNVKAKSYFYTDTEDLTVADNFQNGIGVFNIIDGLISRGATTNTLLVRTPNTTLKSDDASQNKIDFTQSAQANNYLKVYVDENLNPTDYKTMLIICGQITLPNGQLNPTKSYYHIVVAGPTTGKYVERNTIYKITAQITGTGSKNNDENSDLNAAINAKVTVLPWKVVNQTEDDAN